MSCALLDVSVMHSQNLLKENIHHWPKEKTQTLSFGAKKHKMEDLQRMNFSAFEHLCFSQNSDFKSSTITTEE